MMVRKALLFWVLFAAIFGSCLAQQSLPTMDVQQFPGSSMAWLSPKEGHTINESEFFDQPGIDDLLGAYDEMVLVTSRQGSGGITHRRYQQVHFGYEVEGAVMATHEKNGQLRSANGQLAYLPMIEEPRLTQEEAIYTVQSRLGMLGPVASEGEDYIMPKVDLIHAPETWETQGLPLTYRLAYRIGAIVAEPFSSTVSYVDAHTGEIFRLEPGTHECSAGNGLTLYNGWQAITTKYYNFLGTHYELRDECRGELIHTRIDNHEGHFNRFYKHSRCDDVKDGDNIWMAPEDRAAVSLHWAGEMYWDYLFAKLGRNGLDGAGGKVKLVYHPLQLRIYLPNSGPGQNGDTISPFNARWERLLNEAHFGRGDGISPWVSLDIVSHELTHAVINFEYDLMLTGGNESRALNESFADIFGICSEWYNLPLHDPSRQPDFTMGEDVANGPLRSMSDPMSLNMPRAFQGTFWWLPPNDEPHHNSSVQTYWFYLLAFGSAGKQVEPNTSVCGIGMDNAVQIAYGSIRNYFVVGATYLDARQATIQSAIDTFGSGSFEAEQCANAWAAVNVGTGANFCNPVSLETELLGQRTAIEVYPNPSNGVIHITVLNETKVLGGNFTLWNNIGARIAEIPMQDVLYPGSHHWVIDCSNFAEGTYHLLFSAKESKICKRVSVIH